MKLQESIIYEALSAEEKEDIKYLSDLLRRGVLQFDYVAQQAKKNKENPAVIKALRKSLYSYYKGMKKYYDKRPAQTFYLD